jgi:hypothetical protein
LDQNTLHLAADGCFKLNRLKRSSAAKFNPKINQFYCAEELNSSHIDQDTSGDIGCASTFTAARETLKSNRYDEKGVIGLFCAHQT